MRPSCSNDEYPIPKSSIDRPKALEPQTRQHVQRNRDVLGHAGLGHLERDVGRLQTPLERRAQQQIGQVQVVQPQRPTGSARSPSGNPPHAAAPPRAARSAAVHRTTRPMMPARSAATMNRSGETKLPSLWRQRASASTPTGDQRARIDLGLQPDRELCLRMPARMACGVITESVPAVRRPDGRRHRALAACATHLLRRCRLLHLAQHAQALQLGQVADRGQQLFVGAAHQDQATPESALPETPDHLDAVHLGHVEIADDDIDRRLAAGHACNRLDAIARGQNLLHADAGQHLLHLHQHDRVVIHHQHRFADRFAHGRWLQWRRHGRHVGVIEFGRLPSHLLERVLQVGQPGAPAATAPAHGRRCSRACASSA